LRVRNQVHHENERMLSNHRSVKLFLEN
jgi:hypothetical protein